MIRKPTKKWVYTAPRIEVIETEAGTPFLFGSRMNGGHNDAEDENFDTSGWGGHGDAEDEDFNTPGWGGHGDAEDEGW